MSDGDSKTKKFDKSEINNKASESKSTAVDDDGLGDSNLKNKDENGDEDEDDEDEDEDEEGDDEQDDEIDSESKETQKTDNIKKKTESASNTDTQDESKPKRKRKRGTKESHLSLEQKKLHHIQSEHKRREQIRSTFDTLVDLVPNLEVKENRSELAILVKTADYIEHLRKENSQLVELAKAKGKSVPSELLK